MMNNLANLKNEEGSAIVIAMLTLLVVTIIGVSSSNKTTAELQIVRNEGIYKQNLYLAEAAAQEAIQKIWNLTREDPFAVEDKTPPFLNTPTEAMDNVDNWDDDGVDGDDTAEVSALDPNASLAVEDAGISDDGSLEMTATSVHDFRVFGLSQARNGRVFIQIGFRERF